MNYRFADHFQINMLCIIDLIRCKFASQSYNKIKT